MKKYSTLAVVTFSNGGPFVYRVKSDEVITMAKVIRHFEKTEGFNIHKDNIELLQENELTEINL